VVKKTVGAVEARQKFGEILDGVFYRDDEVVIKRAGKVMGVIVPLSRYQAIEAKRQRLVKIIAEIHEHNKGVPYDVIKTDVDAAVAEVRSSYRAIATEYE